MARVISSGGGTSRKKTERLAPKTPIVYRPPKMDEKPSRKRSKRRESSSKKASREQLAPKSPVEELAPKIPLEELAPKIPVEQKAPRIPSLTSSNIGKTSEILQRLIPGRYKPTLLSGEKGAESLYVRKVRSGEELGSKRPPGFMTQEELAQARLDLGYEGFEAEDARLRAEARQAYIQSGLSKPQQNARFEADRFARSIGQTDLPLSDYELEDPLGISPLVRILENRGIQVPEGATPSDLKDILLASASDPSLPPLSEKWVSALEAANIIAPTSPFVDPNEGVSGGYGGGGNRYRSGGGGGYRGTGRSSLSAATLGLINWRIG